MSSFLPCRSLILRSTPGKGRSLILQSFSDTFGRLALAVTPPRGVLLSPFNLIHCTVANIHGDFGIAQDVEVLDTFTELRSHKDASKSALYIRTIIEHCLPPRAISPTAWTLTTSLLGLLHLFHDWKTAPLILALSFFEQEGSNPQMLTSLSSISESARKTIEHLLISPESTWIDEEIPEDLFKAVLETIGVIAKEGT
jgi:recombinational DNA repair protein (RecF pathway)